MSQIPAAAAETALETMRARVGVLDAESERIADEKARLLQAIKAIEKQHAAILGGAPPDGRARRKRGQNQQEIEAFLGENKLKGWGPAAIADALSLPVSSVQAVLTKNPERFAQLEDGGWRLKG